MKIKAVPKEVIANANKAAPNGEYPLRLLLFSNTALNCGKVDINDREVPTFIKKSMRFIISSPFASLGIQGRDNAHLPRTYRYNIHHLQMV